MTNDELGAMEFLTAREAADLTGYSRADSFTRAWRRRGLPIFRRAGARLVVRREDLRRFVVPETGLHTGQS